MAGTSSGKPEKLAEAGDHFRDLSSSILGVLSQDVLIRDGGQVEREVLNEGGDDGGFGDYFAKVAQDLYTKLISGSEQVWEAAFALYNSAARYSAADHHWDYNVGDSRNDVWYDRKAPSGQVPNAPTSGTGSVMNPPQDPDA